MSILALDYGEKYIGLAISDPQNKMALKLKRLENKKQDFVIKELKQICQAKGVTQVVIGLPKSLQGEDTKQTKKVREFSEYVKIKLELPVKLEDERLTSKQAQKSQVKDIHQESARLILETYLDRVTKK